MKMTKTSHSGFAILVPYRDVFVVPVMSTVQKHWYVGKFLPGEKCTEMCSNLQGSVMCDLTKNFTILLCMRLGRHGLCIGPR